MDIWESIYKAAAALPESNPIRKERHFRYKNKISQQYTHLCNNLSDENLRRVKHMMAKQDKFIENETRRFFVNGFKLGMSFAIEILNQ